MRRLLMPAVAVALIALAEFGLVLGHGFSASSHAVQLGFAVLACAPVAMAQERPASALALTGGLVGLEAVLITPPQVFAEGLAAAIVCFAAGVRGDPRRLPLAFGAFLAGGLVRDMRDPLYNVPDTLADALIFGLVLGAGLALRVYLRRSVRLTAEADAARDALAAERGRIARELHDIVAHSVSIMVVQATSAGSRSTDAESRQAFADIATAGRQSLNELRRLLGVLREPDAPPASLTPQPGLADIPELVAQVRAAGQPVTLSVIGPLSQLSPGVALSVYRVVQEGLTNAVRHATGATTYVRVSCQARDLIVEVLDTGGRPSGPSGSGRGLAGLRERIKLYDGELDAGPDGDGFALRARLPAR